MHELRQHQRPLARLAVYTDFFHNLTFFNLGYSVSIERPTLGSSELIRPAASLTARLFPCYLFHGQREN